MNIKAFLVFIILGIVAAFAALNYFDIPFSKDSASNKPGINIPTETPPAQTEPGTQPKVDSKGKLTFYKFKTAQDFKDYLLRAEATGSKGGAMNGRMMTFDSAMPTAAPMPAPMPAGNIAVKESAPSRVSETNVQVAGIDEPDMVKTDGKNLFVSAEIFRYYTPRPMPAMDKMIAPEYYGPSTNIIKAFPLADLSKIGEIKEGGNLLISGNNLVIFASQGIYTYDLSDPKNPKKTWDFKYESNSYLAGARLYGGKMYIVLKNNINSYAPCPIKPLTVNGAEFSIRCDEIYYPNRVINTDTTFTSLKVDPGTGKIENKITFVGNSGDSVIYMSPTSLYITYTYQQNYLKFILGFFKTSAGNVVPQNVISRLEKIDTYDISQSAKEVELQNIWSNFMNSLSDDDRMKVQNDLTNKMADYYKVHFKELESTGIAKIDIDSFVVKAQGEVAGHPLNQFSLDEYNDYLRIATTIGGRWYGYLWGVEIPTQKTANDVYILDKSLVLKGAVTDLGQEGESIFGVRFIQDKGYVVTFRQTDPFYVLDLSNPNKPSKAGELKIPGYSGYLHPINKDKIIGVGQEERKVKISLFDVSNPSDPKEISKYNLSDWYSEATNNHHAFLMDEKHKVFFMPGSNGGYIFSYDNDKFELKKAVSKISPKRAVYIEDFMYIIADQQIVVINETNWQKEKELEIK